MISMEFTSKYVHMLEGMGSGTRVTVKKAVSIPVPERSIRNGYIRNQEELSGILIEALVDHDFRSKEVSLTIDSTYLKVKQVDIPHVSRDKALQFVKREFGSIISEEEHLFDYTIENTYKRGRVQQMECTIYAIPRELLIEYSQLCKTLGLKLKRIDVLNDAIIKQLELEYPNIKKEKKKNISPPKKKKKKGKRDEAEETNADEFSALEQLNDKSTAIKGPVKLWVGFYYEKLKLITNGINGEPFIKTIMSESLERNDDNNDDKELIALCVNEIKKFIQFQEEVSPDYPIEQIEVFGEHVLLGQICNVISSFVKKSVVQLSCPKQIKGLSDEEYARYAGGVGSLVRR